MTKYTSLPFAAASELSRRRFVTGAAAGTAVNLIFPSVPLALAVGCMMAALTAAALPTPFMITIVVLLVTGIPATEAIPVILAAVAAHAITFGLGILPRPPAKPSGEVASGTPETGAAAPADNGVQSEKEGQ